MEIKISELKTAIRKVYNLAQDEKYLSIMIWGAMGVGKSQAVKQVADELGIGFIDLRLSLLNPVDLRGLPMVDKENHKALWLEPEFLPNGDSNSKGILFLDEINLAPQAVMSAGYQLILDRKLGEYSLPKGWIVISAGNRAKDNASTTRFPSPLANRFIHYEISEPDVEEWKSWAIKNGIREEIIAFLSKMPQHLFRQPKATDLAFPTPRSWEFASHLLEIDENVDKAIGGGVASEFYGFLNVYKEMPDVERILQGKEEKVPEKIDVLYALSVALGMRTKEEHLEHVFNYIKKMGSKNKEFEVLTITTIKNRSDEMLAKVAQSKKWAGWIKENRQLLDEIKDAR